ncbi:hypothetical protein FRB96_009258 [Tulasnella sp. 330]|nr:hypothetical protein FRB96_009258 [Tulasnella sp. 330]
MLKPWIRDYSSMRCMMYETDTVISGSWALAFILGSADPTEWQAKDVDLFVPMGKPCEELLTYLTTREGYTQIEPKGNQQMGMLGWVPGTMEESEEAYEFFKRGVKKVYKLTKLLNNGDVCTIDVIESRHSAAFAPIVSFDYTCVMNWIAHDSIVVLYPNFTTTKIGINQRCNSVADRDELRSRKYEERRFVHCPQTIDLPGAPACKEACMLLIRDTLDSGIMVLSLADAGGDAIYSRMPRASWSLGSNSGQSECRYPGCPQGKTESSLKQRHVNYKSALRSLLRDCVWQESWLLPV